MDEIAQDCIDVIIETPRMGVGEIITYSIIGGMIAIPAFMYWCYSMYSFGLWLLRSAKDNKLNG